MIPAKFLGVVPLGMSLEGLLAFRERGKHEPGWLLTTRLSLLLSPAWHSVPSQLLLWPIHARSKGTSESHLQLKTELKICLLVV